MVESIAFKIFQQHHFLFESIAGEGEAYSFKPGVSGYETEAFKVVARLYVAASYVQPGA